MEAAPRAIAAARIRQRIVGRVLGAPFIWGCVRKAGREGCRDSRIATEGRVMPLRSLKPFIPSGPDFQTAIRFFRDLGFTVQWEVPGLAELELAGAAFLLQEFHNQEMQSNLMMMVEVEDLDAWWKRIVDSGVVSRY